MNKIILIGRLGNDPELRSVGNSQVCKFTIATSETYIKDGERITDTEWHSCIFWGKQAEIIHKYVHKGDLFSVTGKVKTRKYDDKSGVTHWATEIICNEFEFLQGKKEPVENKPAISKEDIMNMPDLPF